MALNLILDKSDSGPFLTVNKIAVGPSGIVSSGEITVQSGGLTVQSGGIAVQGGDVVVSTGSVECQGIKLPTGGITVDQGGVTISQGDLRVGGTIQASGKVTLDGTGTQTVAVTGLTTNSIVMATYSKNAIVAAGDPVSVDCAADSLTLFGQLNEDVMWFVARF